MFPFFVGCKKFIMGYKVILLTVQANCVTKKTPETLEVFPKETFTSLMVVLQSSKSLNLCLDSSRKMMWVCYKLALIFALIFTWVWYYLLAENFALKVDKSFCPVIIVSVYFISAIAACAAASLAIGTRNGEQDT